ncbi:Transcriptional coactivator Hfi1/Transcriptional adapter 1 [Senna tora]|uniref:Transcriptional coactivator Hfi1/Transcriptional adapter 1 n=1 Tax=Senna tora TaxID=362788 RepID=A0A835CGI3_9FABA|nr:Transcriptional coactivator Hfi1/Transcriptional adapter 1 [Senna tora]
MTLPNRNYTRMDTLELKALIFRKVGHQRSVKYFDQLRKLFSSKISKSEFDRCCIKTIGRENIPLHNQLIKAILKNACLAKVPPPRVSSRIGSPLSVKVPNGDAFTPSLQRGRSLAGRDRKLKDRQSPLGPLGKPQSVTSIELISKAQEQQSATELHSLGSRPPASVEDGEEVEQMAGSPSIQSRSPVTAPLGISMNFGCGRKHLSNVSTCGRYYPETCQSSGDLPDTSSLRRRLEQKLEKEGLTMTVDCVNLLNNSLDAYMKRLIESCISLTGSRRGSNVLPPGRYMQTITHSACASLLDFRVAMELNPQILGPDWPIQLEKIGLSASEE